MPWGVAAAVGGAVIGGIATENAAGKAADAQDRATAANAYQGEIAKEQWSDYKGIYQPLEKQMVADATAFDGPEAYQQAASKAQATVSNQLGLARERLARAPGLDPSSAAAQAAMTNLELQGAAIGATSQNQAREQVTDRAYARKLDAIGLGKGLVTNASTGMASAAATAQSQANAQSLAAGQTAAGVGSMVGGLINAAGKADWSKLGGSTSSATPLVLTSAED